MNKSMYSLMLTDRSVKALDALAHSKGVSRSSLADRILAEYLQISTAETQITEIYEHTVIKMKATNHLRAKMPDLGSLLTISGIIKYPYNPTIRYVVELSLSSPQSGEIRVSSRTQNAKLMLELQNFYMYWLNTEQQIFSEPLLAVSETGVLSRQIRFPNENAIKLSEFGRSIGEYILLFDNSLNKYISDKSKTISFIDDYNEYINNNFYAI